MIARIHSLLASSQVNGPGNRMVVWFQGCNLGCPGCWNPETHAIGGKQMTRTALLDWIIKTMQEQTILEHGALQGITFSGGEPMQQAPALYEIINYLHKFYPTLSLGLFSGYSERELQTGNYNFQHSPGYEHEAACMCCRRELWHSIRTKLDFAVLGRFNGLQPNTDPMTTSSNQKLKLYSNRYTATDFAPQAVEVQIGSEGLVQVTGFPTLGNLV